MPPKGGFLMPAERQCRRCGLSYPLNFFRLNHASYVYDAQRKTLCLGCEQTARDTEKQRSRWRSKVQATIRHHARSLSASTGVPITAQRLTAEYGWDISRMAHEAEHAYSNGCGNCGLSFVTMGHGLHDITLDVVDRNAPAVYGINTRWICGTCNRQKGTRTVTQMAELNIGWARWNTWKRTRSGDPWVGTMFQEVA